ncbi:polysaccharide lyase family 7 protein [Glaciecola sp. MH2013]|uniref:polysaccharide lyase family 7 protein n=1 Tax=Glaciecola sp. MH2013 TaxID=2785524 RepID=UPI00189C92B0|nr:polysaccharide lyase family 7 protein [Glaciecola sp. MH2013]MBF7074383.1 polysaccharide lyase family 7 protein [Glaciecola sp. MH2013]
MFKTSLKALTVLCSSSLFFSNNAFATTIENASFESGLDGWTVVDSSGAGISMSDIAYSGASSVLITEDSGHRVFQIVDAVPNSQYKIQAFIRGDGRLRITGDSPTIRRTKRTGNDWERAVIRYNSGESGQIRIVLEKKPNSNEVIFDDISIECDDINCQIDEPKEQIDFGLDADKEPWENFDLQGWVIDTPAFDDDGFSQRFGENDWDQISDESRKFFFTHTDGGMRFVNRVDGAKTSENTAYSRSELREMLRRGNTNIATQGVTPNNWALGYQPTNGGAWGGANGKLSATLRVNQVTTTGEGLQVGRTIIGQIHADDDEPARLYYRKNPGDELGCIYVAHEIRGANDIDFNILGDEDCTNPNVGIALNELFSYEIINEGEFITVVVRSGDQDGEIIGETTIDMVSLNSGYNRSDEWMYFKAGTYSQNNTGVAGDGDIVTFYRLNTTHGEVPNEPIEEGEPTTQVAVIMDTLDSDTGELRYKLPEAQTQGRVEVTFTRTDDAVGSTDAFITLFNESTNNAGSILDLRIRDNSFGVRYPAQDLDTALASVVPGEYQTAVITWEYPDGDTSTGQLPTLNLFIDDVLVLASFQPIGADPIGGVTHVSFRFGSNSGVLTDSAMFIIDDLKIFSDIEGNTSVLEDDFESYAVGANLDPDNNASSIYTNNTSEATVASVAAHKELELVQFVAISDTVADDTGELRYELPSAQASGKLEVVFSRTDDVLGNADAFISLFNESTNNAGSILDLRVKDDSFAIRYPATEINTDLAAVSPDTFHTVVITWEYPDGDTSTGQLPILNVFVDGQAISEPFTPVGADPVGGVTHISFRFGSNSGVLADTAVFRIDDLAIYSDAEGTSVVFSDDFEGYAPGTDLDPDNNPSSPYKSNTSEAVVVSENF